MTFNIDDVRDISKLLGMIRLLVKGEYKVSRELFDQLLHRMQRYAKEHQISIEIVSADGERVIAFTTGGILVGALFGLYFGQLPGALLGAVIGGLAGFCGAHAKLLMKDRPTDDFLSFVIV